MPNPMARMSVRARLTLVYGALFLVSTTVLVVTLYALTARAIEDRFGSNPISTVRPSVVEEIITSGDRARAIGAAKAELARQLEAQKQEVLAQLLQTSLLMLLAFGLVAVLIGYLVAGRMLRPLHTVTATARRLSESNLHERIALAGPQDEIKDLADTFDRMLDRLGRAFDAQRRFVANASHELRTPLTINRTVLEVAIASRRNPPETKALADVLLGNTARHERLIEGLLLLARSEREPQDRTATPLPDVVRSALDQLGEAPGEVEVEAGLEDAVVEGDAVLLERCAVNLLENALKYNVSGGRVWVRTGVRDGLAVLHVANTGKPVPSYELGRIFEPFRRLRADRIGSAEGAGLGLSIVRAVVDAHGGRIETLPRPDGGLAITVLLPAAPADRHRQRLRAGP
ncbi:HAMP domain-containing sensor histidine kinase [Actinomadura viridis]|uniref:histidine kinase n=1 Tax=Actinomadura viridis TaxID=58110 RepID=A0A931DPL6_9ACTN|nr:HAMP domain-containing sensor histidine kinase [Actinomadura viridis]MBG6090990.1 signal transduction histidine kinase [Actinomadura viridis]